MKTLSVYDPAMCCSTGVCGPQVDPKLAQFASDLKWLAEQRVKVERYNLAQTPAVFAENATVRATLQEKGESALLLLIADGTIVASGRYPTRDELCNWFGLVDTSFLKPTPTPTGGRCC